MSHNPLDLNPDMHIHNEEVEQLLGEIGQFLSAKMLPGWGFMLMLFSFGPNGSTFYISDAHREDMVKHLREMADKLEREKLTDGKQEH